MTFDTRKYRPYVFTEMGVAMLSSVLRSEAAVQVNISIMRAFVRMRSLLKENESLTEKLEEHIQGTDKMFKVVLERLDDLENPEQPKKRKRIGLK